MFEGNGQKIPGNIELTCSDLRETSPALCLHLLLSIADIRLTLLARMVWNQSPRLGV